MKVTRVVFQHLVKEGDKQFLGLVSVVLDDCLRLNRIRLFKRGEKCYLILPSDKDIFDSIVEANEGVELVMPEEPSSSKSKKVYNEFYNPVESSFYSYLLNTILDGYDYCVENGKNCYIP